MATSTTVGTVSSIWRFPVKSMKGTRVDHGEFSERGLLGDRAYALIDTDTGKVASAKSVRLFPTCSTAALTLWSHHNWKARCPLCASRCRTVRR